MTPDTARRIVEEIADSGSLSKWEASFIVSLTDKLDRGQPLSERETEKLEEIYDEHFR